MRAHTMIIIRHAVFVPLARVIVSLPVYVRVKVHSTVHTSSIYSGTRRYNEAIIQ